MPRLAKTMIIYLAAALTLGGVMSGSALAETNKSALETLRGIKAVTVVITGLSREAEKDGLHKNDLQHDVEERLRQAGIRVLNPAEGMRSPGQPHLFVRFIDQKRSDMELYAISIAVHLVQMVRLARDGKVVTPAETWGMTGVVSVGARELTSVRKLVGDYVDMFVNSLRTVNPEGPPSAAQAPAAGDQEHPAPATGDHDEPAPASPEKAN